jgi:hypothetical protein
MSEQVWNKEHCLVITTIDYNQPLTDDSRNAPLVVRRYQPIVWDIFSVSYISLLLLDKFNNDKETDNLHETWDSQGSEYVESF